MSFSREIQDFVGGFKDGWKLATPSYSEEKARDHIKERRELEDAQNSAEGAASSGLGANGRSPGYAIPGVSPSGGTSGGGGSRPATFVGQGANPDWAKAISGIESGGRYDAVGPTHKRYGRALGKYQVMESNVPSWTKEALGYSMTGDQFLNDPSAQDAVFRYKFGDYVRKYGNPQDAASAWHSGRPLAQAARAGAKDSLGTTTSSYVEKFSKALGAGGAGGTTRALPVAGGAGAGGFGLGGVTGKRASLEEDEREDMTQFAAEGGRVRSREEIQEELRAKATEDDPPELAPRAWENPPARVTADASEPPATTYASLPPAPEPARPSWQDPPQEARRSWQDPPQEARRSWEDPPRVITATEPQTPAARPKVTDAGRKRTALPVEREPRQGVPLPPRRPASAIPDNGAQLPGEGLQAGTDEPYDPKALVQTGGITEAIDAGFNAIGEFFGFSRSKAGIPEAADGRQAALQRFQRNEGAATRAEVQQVDDMIDPQRRLTDDERAVARLYGGYKFYLSRGEPERAKKYAASMLMYSRLHTQTAGALATEALNAGNVPLGAKIIQEAHNEIPDGHSLKIEGIGPKGVSYAMYDADGDLTERGEASVNQLMQTATGMRNGSEWLTQMQQAGPRAMTAAQKARQKRQEQDDAAAGAYYAGQADSEFLSSLSPESRAAFDKASPQLKAKMVQQAMREREQNRKETMSQARLDRDEANMTARQKKEDERRTKAETDANDQQEYAGHIDNIRDAQGVLQAQIDADPYDTAKIKPLQDALAKAKNDASDWTKAGGGRAKYVARLNMDTRAGRGGGVSGGGGGSSAGNSSGRSGGSAAERNAARLDEDVRRAQLQADRTRDPKDIQAAALSRARAAWGKRDTGEDREIQTEVEGAVAQHFKANDFNTLSAENKADAHDMSDAITDIMRGDNGLSSARALDLVNLAVQSGKVTLNDDGSYSVNGSRPVYMSPNAFQAIARIAARRRKAAAPAEQSTANPFRERAGARDLRERERGKTALGADYRPDMSRSEMQRKVFDKEVDDPRNGGVIPFGGT